MKLNKDLLPIRDFKLAALYAAVWILLFWAVGHPIEEWAVTVVVLYVALWISREVVVRAVWLATEALAQRARRVAEKFSIDIPDDVPAKLGSRGMLLLTVIIILTFAAVVGASLTAGIPAASLLGLTPLAAYFSWIGWALFGIGLAGMSLILGGAILTFAAAEALLDGKGIVRAHAITENVAASAAKVAAY